MASAMEKEDESHKKKLYVCMYQVYNLCRENIRDGLYVSQDMGMYEENQ